MSIVNFSGYLSADPELKNVNGTDLLKMRVPVKVGYKDKEVTNWFAADLWGKQATALGAFLRKGAFVVIIGELTAREYESSCEKRTSLDVRVLDIKLGPKSASQGGDQTSSSNGSGTGSREIDDEVPF